MSRAYEKQEQAVVYKPQTLNHKLLPIFVMLTLCVLCCAGSAGVSRAYEAQERAVLQEYHDILQRLVDRAGQKEKEANQQLQKPQLHRESSAPSSRPGSAPAGFADGSQQPLSGQGTVTCPVPVN